MASTARADALPASLPPRGLCRETAAAYIGVSVGTFDQMVAEGQMPAPKRIRTRKVWDRATLDLAFSALPEDTDSSPNPWDAAG